MIIIVIRSIFRSVLLVLIVAGLNQGQNTKFSNMAFMQRLHRKCDSKLKKAEENLGDKTRLLAKGVVPDIFQGTMIIVMNNVDKGAQKLSFQSKANDC